MGRAIARGSGLYRAAVAVALVLVCTGAARSDETSRPAMLRGVGIDQRLNERIPLDLTFRDESGRPVALRQFFGRKPIILVLAYYKCPMLCTLVLNGLTSALKPISFNVGEEFDVVAVSIDPRETPDLAAAKKATHLGDYGRPATANGWHFLTGDAEAIAQLADAVGFRYRFDPPSGEFAHAAGITVLTPDGVIARYYFGVEYSPRDLRLGLVEAAGNRIASPVDQLLLFCFRYDESTSRYTPVVMNIVRLGGGLTVAAMAIGIVLLRRRERVRPAGTAA